MAYTLGNKCAKNLCKRTVLLQLIIENVVTCFFLEHSVCMYDMSAQTGRLMTVHYSGQSGQSVRSCCRSGLQAASTDVNHNHNHYWKRQLTT